MGNVAVSLGAVKIDMAWEWIPLLDFLICLSKIANALQDKEQAIEYFEFTESAETLKFYKEGYIVQILPSFSSNMILTTFYDFNKAIKKFRDDIMSYSKEQLGDKIVNEFLKKYL